MNDAEGAGGELPALVDKYVGALTRYSPETKRMYARAARDFTAWLDREGLTLDDLDRRAVRRYVVEITGRGWSTSTIARQVSALRNFAKWARRSGIVDVDVLKHTTTPPVRHRLPRVPKSDEVREWLDGIRDVVAGFPPEEEH